MEKFYFAIINGPNLNKLGQRDPSLYGEEPFEDTLLKLKEATGDLYNLEYAQSNGEGIIIDLLQKYGNDDKCLGIVLNPGAYAHYSLAIADAITDINNHTPVIEVHISNIFNREGFRSKTVTGRNCSGVISGMGRFGYNAALYTIINNFGKGKRLVKPQI